MDYPSPSRAVEAPSDYDYHQRGDSYSQGPSVQWTPQDNQSYQNANYSRQNGDINIYANNVYIDQNNTVQTDRYNQVYAVPPPVVEVQRTGYYVEPGCNNSMYNDCYGRRDPAAEALGAFAGVVIGGVIGNAIFGRRDYYDRGRYEHHRGGYEYYPQPRYYPVPNHGGYNNYYNGGYNNYHGGYNNYHRGGRFPCP